MKFIFAGRNQDICDYWNYYFSGIKNVEIHHKSVFDLEADALVSPANSFGIMNGGIDMAISTHFGWHLQEAVQHKIQTEYDGELLVGQAFIVPTGNDKIHNLISAPTMRVPLDISNTPNVYLAMRAVILAIQKHNAVSDDVIKSVIISGLGTGTGGVFPHICAAQMKQAYTDFYLGEYKYPKTIKEANDNHLKRI